MMSRRPIQTCSESVNLTLSRPVRPLKVINDLESLRRVLKISQTELGELLAPHRVNGRRGEPYTRAYVSMLESGRANITADVRLAVTGFVRERVERATHGRVTVRVRLGRAWKIEAVSECVVCDRQFVLKRSNQRRCRRHV